MVYGFLEGTIEFSDSSKQWLTGVPDADGATDQNWIRSGTAYEAPNPVMSVTNRYPNTMIGQVMMMRKNTNRSSMEHGRRSCCAQKL